MPAEEPPPPRPCATPPPPRAGAAALWSTPSFRVPRAPEFPSWLVPVLAHGGWALVSGEGGGA